MDTLNLPLSIAPMIDWTYSHFRVFMRMLAPKALLYTEMQTTGAILNNPIKALNYSTKEHPIAIQLGGSDKRALADAAKIAEDAGFDEINLNLGCPSDKVQAGQFGACLMKEPALVGECIQAMKDVVSIPVTAKTRIGIDNQDSYEFFRDFALQLVASGADKLIIHARKAWLKGLNPKQNRTIPSINYDYVYQFKTEIPHIPIVINGNITKMSEILSHLNQVEGVMIGRLACDNPYQIAIIHHGIHTNSPCFSRHYYYEQYLDYLLKEYQQGASLSLLIKPIFNLAHGLPGASQWKKIMMELLKTKNIDLFNELLRLLASIELRKPELMS